MKPLSEQARWYLYGPWPVRKEASSDCYAPEPQAMQELVNAGLATFHKKANFIDNDRWILTAAGHEAKAEMHRVCHNK